MAQEARPTQTDMALSGARETNSLLSIVRHCSVFIHVTLCFVLAAYGFPVRRRFDELASGYLPPQQRDYKPQEVDRSSVVPLGLSPEIAFDFATRATGFTELFLATHLRGLSQTCLSYV